MKDFGGKLAVVTGGEGARELEGWCSGPDE